MDSFNQHDGLAQAFGRRPRVVIGHPLMNRGGSEARVMWLAEAFKADCDVTVLTAGGWDLEDLNRYYGTALKPSDVTARIARYPIIGSRVPGDALRASLFQRHARRAAPDYDLRISAYNLIDWGLPAIHFVADFCWNRELRRVNEDQPTRIIYRDTPLRRAYLSLARACASHSGRDIFKDDQLVANSNWSAAQLLNVRPGSHFPVVYPPVWESFPAVPWPEKNFAFVMIGRIASEKRIEAAISVLQAIRRRGHRVTLHLCGRIPNDTYGRRVTELCNTHREWIRIEGAIHGDRKARILSSCRFGLQMCANEAFGIAVAEMVKAGAITFAPQHGGPAEILQHSDLLFSNETDAVDKIEAVLTSPERQAGLRDHLASRSNLFSAERFMREARSRVSEALVTIRGTSPPVAHP